MNKLLMSAVAAIISLSTLSASHAQSTFSDVPDNHWAAQAVKRLAEAGIIVGRPASIRQKPVRPSSPSNDAASAVEYALWSEPELSGARIRVSSSRNSGDKTLFLDGEVQKKGQQDMAVGIARRIASGWNVISRLSVK